LRTPSSVVLGYGEPVRLARAVCTLLDRKIVPASFVRSWIDSFSRSTEGRTWSDVHDNSNHVNAQTNVTLFLTALVVLAHGKEVGRARNQPERYARRVLRDMAIGF
jgi:hypothetical protein